MKYISGLLFLSALCSADKPAVAPAYEAPAPATYGAPVAKDTYSAPVPDTYGSPAAPSNQADTYGSPAAPLVSGGDTYGSPAAPPVTGGDSYGSPAAPVQTATAPVGNQGYYYYYYPVRQNAPAPAQSEDDDNGILGIVTALLTKKIIVVAIGIVAFLVITALGINIAVGGRSFSSSSARAFEMVEPYMTEDNLIALADFVNKSLGKFQ